MVANPQNLRVPTSEEARKNGKKGGIASGKARRAKRSMREYAQMYGELPLAKGKEKDPKTSADIAKSNPTMDGAVVAKLYEMASRGNLKAIDILIHLKGQNAPTEVKVETVAPEEMSLEELAEKLRKGQ